MAPARGLTHRFSAQALTVVGAWAVSRGLVAVMGALVMLTTGATFIDVVGNWDVQHFAFIAVHGYEADPQEMAFFPGLPLLMRAGMGLGIAPEVFGVVLSLVASALAAWALMRLGGAWAAVAWLFAPAAVFTTVGYTEALFCAAAFWAWERARSDHWAQAALLAAVACTFRVSGLFLIGALGLLALSWPAVRSQPLVVRMRAALPRITRLLVPMAVMAGYAFYLWTLTGSWTAWYSAQEAGWQRTLTWPWQAVRTTLEAIAPGGYADEMGWGTMFRFELVSFVVGLLAVGWLLRCRQWGEAGWIGSQLLAFSISYWLMSLNRAVLLWFPVWIILAEIAMRRPALPGDGAAARALPPVVAPSRALPPAEPPGSGHRLLVLVYACGSTTAMLWWSWMFFTGTWAS